MYKIAIFIVFIYIRIAVPKSAFNCKVPNGCELKNIHYQVNYLGIEKTAISIEGLLCDIRDKMFQFDYPMPDPYLDEYCCYFNHFDSLKYTIELHFPKDLIFGKQLNITNILKYGYSFCSTNFNFNFVNLKGLELDIIESSDKSLDLMTAGYFYYFNCIRCTFEFYSNGRSVNTCQDIIDSNKTFVRSLFQLKGVSKEAINMALFDPQFKTTLCPLVFKNTFIDFFPIIGLTDTFYKRSILSIENRTFDDLNTIIRTLYLIAENININSNLLNQLVFQNLTKVMIAGPIKIIDRNTFIRLKSLRSIMFFTQNFRDTIHRNGIEWIRDLNSHLNVNLSSLEDIENNYGKAKMIEIEYASYRPLIRLSKVFPDKDFCLYKDFPFNQMVILFEFVYSNKVFDLIKSKNHYSCTYLWLTQHFQIFLKTRNM